MKVSIVKDNNDIIVLVLDKSTYEVSSDTKIFSDFSEAVNYQNQMITKHNSQ